MPVESNQPPAGIPSTTGLHEDHSKDKPPVTVERKFSRTSSRMARISSMEYRNDTIYARIAYSEEFSNATLAVIVLNAVWIGLDVEYNHPNRKNIEHIMSNGTSVWLESQKMEKLPLEPGSILVENVFCTYFSIELIIRFLAFRYTRFALRDAWFMFDGLLVAFMVIETWILTIVQWVAGGGDANFLTKFSALRLLRLLRLTRMARIIRQVPELLTLLRGMMAAARAVSFILIFLVICMYVFAIVFTAQLGDSDALEHTQTLKYWDRDQGEGHDPTGVELFGSLFDSMMSLFTRGVLGDNLAETLEAIKDRGGDLVCPSSNSTSDQLGDATLAGGTHGDCARRGGHLWLAWLFIGFMIISAFCLLNMLIGVLCEVISECASKENEALQLSIVRQSMQSVFAEMSSGGVITEREFSAMRDNDAVRESLVALGVKNEELQHRLDQMQETLFGNHRDAEDDSCSEASEGSEGTPPLTSRSQVGLTFEQFMERIQEVRPDTPASAMDTEILRVKVEKEEKAFNRRLDQIEKVLSKAFSEPGYLQKTIQSRGNEAESRWRCVSRHGVGILRKPALGSAAGVTGETIHPLEEFAVSTSRNLKDPTSGTIISFMRLLDGRGWVFDRVPAEIICEPIEANEYDIIIERDSSGNAGFTLELSTLRVGHVEHREDLHRMKVGDKVLAVNGNRVFTKEEYYANAKDVAKFQLTIRPEGNFSLGQRVLRRNLGDGRDWAFGYVTQLEPLKVSSCDKPDAMGFQWDEVRRIEAESKWRCMSQRGVGIRREPNREKASRTGETIEYLESFSVAEKVEVKDANLRVSSTFLKLLDGRGWVFDRIPEEHICEPVNALLLKEQKLPLPKPDDVGVDDLIAAWLQEVPSEVLLSVLESRGPLDLASISLGLAQVLKDHRFCLSA